MVTDPLPPPTTTADPLVSPDCWQQIGVYGDRSCDQLLQHRHCHHCPIYRERSHQLLNRPSPPDYIQTWTERLQQPDSPEADQNPAPPRLAFRLGTEWFSLPVALCQSVNLPGAIHSLPGSPSPALIGLANLRGELLLCIDLRPLLNLESTAAPTPGTRWIVLAQGRNRWIVPVDEVLGLYSATDSLTSLPPATLYSPDQPPIQTLTSWQDHTINQLDPQALIATLQQHVTL
jgi:chemotaxis-related protein WspD